MPGGQCRILVIEDDRETAEQIVEFLAANGYEAKLVDNAIKHGRDAGQVIVEVKMSDGGATISVGDDGPGIPVDEYSHVFKRFYRLERSRRTPGNGLGLSLVAAVARLHEAHIEMFDNAPGLKIQLQFPDEI